MLTPIPLTDCPGLIDLLLTVDDDRTRVVVKGIEVGVDRIGDAAYLEAVGPDFSFFVGYPGWYAGEHGAPALVALVGDPVACSRWLPINRNDKLAIINRLPLDVIDQTLSKLAA